MYEDTKQHEQNNAKISSFVNSEEKSSTSGVESFKRIYFSNKRKFGQT